MKTLGKILWVVFGGLGIAIEYILSSLVMMLTIIGIPFGIQTLKLSMLALWPFGKKVVRKPTSGCLNTAMNVIWFFVGGLGIAISHWLMGLLFYITVVGIPFGKQHMKLAHIALTPFGREIIES